MPVLRFLVVAALLAGGVAAGLLVADHGAASRTAVRSRSSPAGAALRVLHTWDEQRARAYATGSTTRLRELYVPGAAAGAADLRMLRAYVRRGLRVQHMQTQVLRLAMLDSRAGWRRMRVVDRLVAPMAVQRGRSVSMPRDRATTHVITMMRGGDGRWRVAAVTNPGSPNQ